MLLRHFATAFDFNQFSGNDIGMSWVNFDGSEPVRDAWDIQFIFAFIPTSPTKDAR